MELKIDEKSWYASKILNFIIMLLMPLALAGGIACHDFSVMDPRWLFTLGLDFAASIVGLLLYMSCVKDVTDQRGTTMCLSGIIFFDGLAVFADAVCWLVDGVAGVAEINFLANEIYYLTSVLVVESIWHYLVEVTDPEDTFLRRVTRILNAGAVVDILLIVGNVFGKYLFDVDSAGIYARTGIFWISDIYPVLAFLCCIALIFGQKCEKKKRRILASFIVIPLIGLIFQVLFMGISLTYASIMVATLLVFCNLFEDQSVTLAAEHMEVVKRENELLNMKVEHARIDTELDMATRIQASVLPSIFPPFPDRQEFDIFASMTPAKEVGGDFYDFFMIDDSHLALVIADVSGKGVPAALFMMITKILIKTHMQNGIMDPGEVLTKVNSILMENNKTGYFVTVWLGVYDINTGSLRMANGGHEDPAYCAKGGSFELLKYKHGFVVAGMEGIVYRTFETSLKEGDCLVVYTDGVTEATNGENELFGTKRLLESLDYNRDRSMKDLVENVKQDANVFTADAGQFDDMTMVAFRVLSIPGNHAGV